MQNQVKSASRVFWNNDEFYIKQTEVLLAYPAKVMFVRPGGGNARTQCGLQYGGILESRVPNQSTADTAVRRS